LSGRKAVNTCRLDEVNIINHLTAENAPKLPFAASLRMS
jgi:hypothetical protein